MEGEKMEEVNSTTQFYISHQVLQQISRLHETSPKYFKVCPDICSREYVPFNLTINAVQTYWQWYFFKIPNIPFEVNIYFQRPESRLLDFNIEKHGLIITYNMIWHGQNVKRQQLGYVE